MYDVDQWFSRRFRGTLGFHRTPVRGSVRNSGISTQLLKRRLLGHGDYSNISNCRRKILAIFRGIFIIFAVFQNSSFLIPIFLSEPLSVLCGTQRSRETTAYKNEKIYIYIYIYIQGGSNMTGTICV
jgi:hypothetical protein